MRKEGLQVWVTLTNCNAIFKFWVDLTEKSLESQQKHAFHKKNCEQHWVQTTILRATGVLSFSSQFDYPWDTNRFNNGIRQNWGCLQQSWSLHILSVCHYFLSILSRKFLTWKWSFQCCFFNDNQNKRCFKPVIFSQHASPQIGTLIKEIEQLVIVKNKVNHRDKPLPLTFFWKLLTARILRKEKKNRVFLMD